MTVMLNPGVRPISMPSRHPAKVSHEPAPPRSSFTSFRRSLRGFIGVPFHAAGSPETPRRQKCVHTQC